VGSMLGPDHSFCVSICTFVPAVACFGPDHSFCVSICTFVPASASVFVLVYRRSHARPLKQLLRQYLYFFTSFSVSICASVTDSASVFALLYRLLHQYLYFCTSTASKLSTWTP
jgi:hypothetical protein